MTEPIASIERAGAAARIAFAGELDMAARFRAETTLEGLLGDGLRALEIDLTRVTFIDSTGMGMLLEIHERARREDFALRIIRGPREVQQVFEVSGLATLLPFADAPGEDDPPA